MMFEKKKIASETLSEYLSAVRRKLDLTVEDVAGKTGIKPKFLENLEAGNFGALPPFVYVLGFLKQLSLLYNLEPQVLIDQYRKEMGIYEQVVKKTEDRSWPLKKYLGKLVITPKFLSVTFGLVFVSISLLYIIWQVLSINKTPSLEIFQPTDRQVIWQSFADVKGKTDPGITLTVNDQNVFVDSQGNFQTQLGLSVGPKELRFIARNKFDKSATKTILVTQASQPSKVGADSALQLKLEFSGDVELAYSIDDQSGQTIDFHNGDSKMLQAANKIVISTSDAGATRATFNGQVVGPLGRSHEKLNNIPFFAGVDATNGSLK